ncbi:hypothetical protein cypCar_00019250 [Cyprinus carpio]|nr:hypothetical protein cypCar_00019250 [Cyprinus carpio]
MQNLNDRLATYLETVRRLEQENSKLEMQIREALEKGGPETRDYSKYNAILDDLRREEVGELRNQISLSGVQVDVDAPKGQDLSQVMEEIRGNYEKIALKNAEELKMWHESQKASLEDTLRNTELRSNTEVERYNGLTLQLEAELSQLRSNITEQGQEYEALLNIKMKLEAEINTYKKLLDGGDFKLQDAIDDQE